MLKFLLNCILEMIKFLLQAKSRTYLQSNYIGKADFLLIGNKVNAVGKEQPVGLKEIQINRIYTYHMKYCSGVRYFLVKIFRFER